MPDGLCRAEKAGGFAVTAGIADQRAEALEDVGNGQVRLEFGGARERVVGVALGLVWLTRRDRHAGARRQRHDQKSAGCCRDGLVGPAAGREQIPARQRGLRTIRATHRRRRLGQETHVLPRRFGRLQGRRRIAGGQGRDARHRVGQARVDPA